MVGSEGSRKGHSLPRDLLAVAAIAAGAGIGLYFVLGTGQRRPDFEVISGKSEPASQPAPANEDPRLTPEIEKYRKAFRGATNVRAYTDDPRPIVIELMSEGRPAGALSVRVVHHRLDGKFWRVFTRSAGATGRLRFVGTNGLYSARVFPTAGMYGSAAGRLDFKDRGLTIRVRLRPAVSLSGTVVLASGKPLAGATVFFAGDVNQGYVTDRRGRFTAPRLSNAPYRVRIVHPDYRSASARVAPGADVQLRLPERVKERRVYIPIDVDVVVESGGKRAPAPDGLPFSRGVVKGGAFRFRTTVGARPRFWLQAHDRYAIKRVEGLPVAAGRRITVVLVPPRPLEVEVTSAGKRLPGAWVFPLPDPTTPVGARFLRILDRDPGDLFTSIQGLGGALRRLREVAPGLHRGPPLLPDRKLILFGLKKGFTTFRGSVAAGRTPSRIELRRTFELRGMVLHRTAGLAGYRVVIRGRGLARRTVSNPQGQYELAGLLPGRYTLYACPRFEDSLAPSRPPGKHGWTRLLVELKGTTVLAVEVGGARALVGLVNIRKLPAGARSLLAVPYRQLARQFARARPPFPPRFVWARPHLPEKGLAPVVAAAPVSRFLTFKISLAPGVYAFRMQLGPHVLHLGEKVAVTEETTELRLAAEDRKGRSGR